MRRNAARSQRPASHPITGTAVDPNQDRNEAAHKPTGFGRKHGGSHKFGFEERARSRPKPIAQAKLEQDLEAKRREEEAVYAHGFTANEVRAACALTKIAVHW